MGGQIDDQGVRLIYSLTLTDEESEPVAINAEQIFKTRLDALYNDAVACARYCYTQLTIDVSTDPQLLEFLNFHPGFWNTVRSGLQASAVVALGRIFDSRRDSNGAEKLLRCAETNPGIFSREALKRRNIQQGLNDDDAAAYVVDAFEPGQAGLQPLRDAYTGMRELYERTVEPVRHNVFAHAGCLTLDERNELFQNVPIRDLERLVVFPLQLWDALYDLYWNGRRPVLRDAPTVISDVIEAGAPPHTSTWAHQHAAASTQSLMEFLRPLYPELYEPGD